MNLHTWLTSFDLRSFRQFENTSLILFFFQFFNFFEKVRNSWTIDSESSRRKIPEFVLPKLDYRSSSPVQWKRCQKVLNRSRVAAEVCKKFEVSPQERAQYPFFTLVHLLILPSHPANKPKVNYLTCSMCKKPKDTTGLLSPDWSNIAFIFPI